MVFEKQDGQDLVFMANDCSFGAQPTESHRINGITGKTTMTAGIAMPGTPLQDTWDKIAADAAAATTTGEHLIFRAANPITVKGVRFIPDAALTASDSNYATITVTKRNADNSNPLTVAIITTQTTGQAQGSGSWVQWNAVLLQLSLANANLATGQLLTITIGKTGSGVVVPWGSLTIDYVLA